MPANTSSPDHQKIMDDLAMHGWTVQDGFLPADFHASLAAECRQRQHDGNLTPAGVGSSHTVQTEIRGDSIRWLEPGQSNGCDRYLKLMDELRVVLNRELFLGLSEYESHFAFYPPGAFYRRHVDRFRDDDRRAVSAVVYLNPDWQAAYGGALRLHPHGADMIDITPLAGRLVLFLSADMPHEVLPASRERMSLAGWFKRRCTGQNGAG